MRVPTPVSRIIMSNPPANNRSANRNASSLRSLGASRMHGATIGSPCCLRMSCAISAARRLSNEITLRPANDMISYRNLYRAASQFPPGRCEHKRMDLQYPVGRFEWPDAVSPADRRRYIDEIEQTPKNMRVAVTGLSDQQLDTPYR